MNQVRICLLIMLGSIVFVPTGCVSDGISVTPSKERLPAVIILHTRSGLTSHEYEHAK